MEERVLITIHHDPRSSAWFTATDNLPVFFSYLVAEWIHFTLFGVILPTIKLKVYTFWGL